MEDMEKLGGMDQEKSGAIGMKEALGDKGYMKAMDHYEQLSGILNAKGIPMDDFMKECGQETDSREEFAHDEEDQDPDMKTQKIAIIAALKKKNMGSNEAY